jgi:hypothetical protein
MQGNGLALRAGRARRFRLTFCKRLVARLSLFRDAPTVVFLEFSKCGDRGVCDAVVPRFKHPHAIAATDAAGPWRELQCRERSSLWVDLAG